jgi:hypothetical protein
MKLFHKSIFIISLFCAAFAQAKSESCATVESFLQEGDVFFNHVDLALFRKVEATQKHWATHIGIIVRDEEGLFYFAESTIPFSKKTPFCEFFDHDVRGQWSLKRFEKAWSQTEISQLRTAVEKRLGFPYDLGFNYAARYTKFCSKFVFEVVKEARGLDLGYFQTFRSMLAGLDASVLKFWNYWFFGKIPFERLTITPASQFHDPQLVEILASEI